MIADTRQMKEPDFVFGELDVAAILAGCLEVIARGRVLVDVGRSPLVIGRQIAQCLLRAIRTRFLIGGVEDGHALEHTVRLLLRILLRGIPYLSGRIGLFEHRQQFRVPMLRVAAVWF